MFLLGFSLPLSPALNFIWRSLVINCGLAFYNTSHESFRHAVDPPFNFFLRAETEEGRSVFWCSRGFYIRFSCYWKYSCPGTVYGWRLAIRILANIFTSSESLPRQILCLFPRHFLSHHIKLNLLFYYFFHSTCDWSICVIDLFVYFVFLKRMLRSKIFLYVFFIAIFTVPGIIVYMLGI